MEIKLDFEQFGNKYSTKFSYKTVYHATDLKRPVFDVIKEIMNKPFVKNLLEEHELDDIKYIQECYTIIDNDLPLEKFKSQPLIVVCNKKYYENDINLYKILFLVVLFILFLIIEIINHPHALGIPVLFILSILIAFVNHYYK